MSEAALALCRRARAHGLAVDWQGAPGLGALLVTGADATVFLQAQLTSDVAGLEAGQGQLSARLERTGTLVAWFSLHRLPEQGQPYPTFLAILPRTEVPALLADLQAFVISDDVLLEDITPELSGLVVQGPTAAADIAGLDNHAVRAEDHGWTIVRSFTGDAGYLRLAPQGAPPVSVTADARWRDGPTAAVAWRWLMLEAGWPVVGADFAPRKQVLSRTGLETQVVSATKGCYLGQEVVARIRTYGSVPAALRGLVFDTLPADTLPAFPAPGSALVAEQESKVGTWSGHALSTVWQAPIALAFLDRDHRTPGTRLDVVMADGRRATAKVTLLPFYRAADSGERARHLHERAVHRFSRGDDDAAVALLEEALRHDPTFAEAYEALGVILGRGERFHAAIDIFKRLEEVAPNEPMVHTNLSLFYMKLGDKDEAENQKAQATLKRFAGLDDERQARAQADTAQAARRADAEHKLSMFDEVLAIDPDDPLALMGLGNALLALDRPVEAEPHLARARTVQEDNSPLYLTHGKVLERLGRRDEAVAAFREGIEVASRKGDLMPLKEMEHRLLLLGVRS